MAPHWQGCPSRSHLPGPVSCPLSCGWSGGIRLHGSTVLYGRPSEIGVRYPWDPMHACASRRRWLAGASQPCAAQLNCCLCVCPVAGFPERPGVPEEVSQQDTAHECAGAAVVCVFVLPATFTQCARGWRGPRKVALCMRAWRGRGGGCCGSSSTHSLAAPPVAAVLLLVPPHPSSRPAAPLGLFVLLAQQSMGDEWTFGM